MNIRHDSTRVKFAAVAAVIALMLGGAQSATADPAPEWVDRVITAIIPVGDNPQSLAVNGVTNTIYVANSGAQSVSVIDGATKAVTATVPMGGTPAGVGVNSVTNLVYVSDLFAARVRVIDGTSNTITNDIAVGSNPAGIAVDEATNTVYVANNGMGSVSVINGATNEVTSTVPVGTGSGALALDTSLGLLYVCNTGDGTVSVIDTATAEVTATYPVGSEPSAIAVDSITHRFTVAIYDQVRVYDGVTGDLVSELAPYQALGIAVDAANRTIYVANGSDVVAFDADSLAVRQALSLFQSAQGIAVHPETGTLYVADRTDGSVSVLPVPLPPVISTATASLVVLAGTRTAALADVDLGSVAYSHDEQSATGSTTLTVNDSSGSAAGWGVTAQVSDFVWSAPGGAATGAPSIPAAHLAVAEVGAVDTVSGQAWSTAPVAIAGALDGPVTLLAAAADTGQGTYTMPVDLSLAIPGTSHAGTYTATLTTTLSVAP